MKSRLFTSVLAAMAIAIGATAAYAEPRHKEKPIFFCGEQHGVPTTFARTRRGDVPIIRWVTTSFNPSGWTPEIRCQYVSIRFQNFHENGTLRYITTGTINRQPVVCGTNHIGGSCSIRGLLFTLRPTDDPNSVIQQLFIDLNASIQLNQSSSSILYDNDGDIYIDLEKIISRRAVDEPRRRAPRSESENESENELYRLW